MKLYLPPLPFQHKQFTNLRFKTDRTRFEAAAGITALLLNFQ